MFYFLNGLYGKKFVCSNNVTIRYRNHTYHLNECGIFATADTYIDIYCGPSFQQLKNAKYLLKGTYSKNCPSIYDTGITGGTSQIIPYENVMAFNFYRYGTYLFDIIDKYGNKFLTQNDTAVILMQDNYTLHETGQYFNYFYLPHVTNIILFAWVRMQVDPINHGVPVVIKHLMDLKVHH